MLRSVGAVALEAGPARRLSNLADGLARDLGAEPPTLFLIFSEGPNALVVRSSGSAIAVTRGLLELYTRTELEAVTAHCLVRLGDRRRMRRAELAVALGPSVRVARRRPGEPAELADDVAAIGATRYPPALAAAIRKAEPASGRFAPLWFVGETPLQLPPERRIAELSDL